jgi:exopolysaccharide biosynthesis protein
LIRFFKKPFRWAITLTLILSLSVTYVLCDTFVFSKAYAQSGQVVTEALSSSTEQEKTSSSTAVATDTEYHGDGLDIMLSQKRINDTTVYIADITTSDASHLLTAFAQGSYGRNIKEKTSEMAEENGAVLAINGDYYGFREDGFVLRNGVLYRDQANGDTDALVIDQNGDFSIVDEDQTDLSSVSGAWQVLSFGPALIEDCQIVVGQNDEVAQSKQSNPRTAIAQLGQNHYAVIVSEGRTDDSQGLSLYELAQVFQDLGAECAYNLDGGGSSTLYFNGRVVNQTVGGRGESERSVSDIVYFS